MFSRKERMLRIFLLNNVDRPRVKDAAGKRILFEDLALPHFNEVATAAMMAELGSGVNLCGKCGL